MMTVRMIINLVVGHSRGRSASDAMKIGLEKAIVSSAFRASSFVISILIATRGSAKITMDTRQPRERDPSVQTDRLTDQPASDQPTQIANRKYGHTFWIYECPLVPSTTVKHYQLRKHGESEVHGEEKVVDLPLCFYLNGGYDLRALSNLHACALLCLLLLLIIILMSSIGAQTYASTRTTLLRTGTEGVHSQRWPTNQSFVDAAVIRPLIKSPTPTCPAVYELPSCLTASRRSSFPRAPTPVYCTGNLRRSQRAMVKSQTHRVE